MYAGIGVLEMGILGSGVVFNLYAMAKKPLKLSNICLLCYTYKCVSTVNYAKMIHKPQKKHGSDKLEGQLQCFQLMILTFYK